MSKISVTVIQSVTNSLSVDRDIHNNTNINMMIMSDLYQFNPISIFITCVSEDSLQQDLVFPQRGLFF